MIAGEVGLEMYWILEGECEVLNKKSELLATIGKGTPFGEMALLSSDTDVRQASVRAKSDISLAVFERDDFRFVLENYPIFR